MIIDSHVHLKHGDANRTEYSAETIVYTMDAVGIDVSVVFAMSTSTRRSIEMALEAYRRSPDRLIPYVYAIPSFERPVNEEIKEAVVRLGFKGVKIHAGEYTIAEYVVDPVVELAEKFEVPCLIDCVGRISDVKRMAEKFPKAKIVVAHFGKYLSADEKLIDQFINLASTHENVYLDTSGVVLTHKIREAIQRIGSNHIVFGTDGPHEEPDTVSFAKKELEKIKSLKLNPTDEENILGKNILRILKI
ncbi:amidohydrolase family protein [Candidatus Bathyarchaeota archaeon]|nr:amidohydrolase family protein [Candidatus Bathyarchaeota archaeon]MBS7617618.1 amidohydrolase family protein [Candidatus Bathyarchaeota archaeon]